jgi:hypothetical protein
VISNHNSRLLAVEPLAPGDLAARWPRLAQRLSEVTDDLRQRTHMPACRHIGTAPIRAVCSMHVDRGLFCPRCCERHVASHSHDEEFLCDECFQFGEVMSGLGAFADLAVEVRGRGMVIGTVAVDGLGLCQTCRHRSKRAA